VVQRAGTSMDFSDHFSGVSSDYARYRPRYPTELYVFLQSLARRHDLAWDCATGTGQAAVALADFFSRVIATDASAEQIARARPHPRVQYVVSPAERTDLDSESVDLIAVAQALHWFDLEAFFAEADRVLTADGVLACWTYGLFEVDNPAVQEAVDVFYADIVDPYWPPERRMVEDGYRSMRFPFDEIPAPEFEIRSVLSVEELEGYLRTWSATQRYVRDRGNDPVASLALGDKANAALEIRWPLAMRIGRRHTSPSPAL
jgi:SAM-dependent methyltransferase